MTDTFSTNNIPSLRQRMINEALDYHQNMNSIVFQRSVQSVAYNDNPSGKSDPSQQDILQEGVIKQKVGDILTQIQKLNQSINYFNNPSTLTGSARPIKTHGETDQSYNSRMFEYYKTERAPLILKYYLQDHPQQGTLDTNGIISDIVNLLVSNNTITKPEIASIVNAHSSNPAMPPPDDGYHRIRNTRIPYIINKLRDDYPTVEFSETPTALDEIAKVLDSKKEITTQELFKILDARSHIQPKSALPVEIAAPITQSTQTESEPIAAGPVSVVSPDARSSSKIKEQIDSALAGIVSSYNTLIDYISFQTRQRLFSSMQEQNAAGDLKSLIAPLKLLIANSSVLKLNNKISGLEDYSRVYNVLDSIVKKIQSSPPFSKVDTSLLTETLPLRRDMINATNFDALKASNHSYLSSLLEKLDAAKLNMEKFHPKSPLEKEARQMKLHEIALVEKEIREAGSKSGQQFQTSQALMARLSKLLVSAEAARGSLTTEDKEQAAEFERLSETVNPNVEEWVSQYKDEQAAAEQKFDEESLDIVERISSHEAEAEDLQTTIEELTADSADLQTTLTDLTQRQRILRDKVSDLLADYSESPDDETKEELDQARDELEDIKGVIADYSKTLKENKTQMADITKILNKIPSQINLLRKKNIELEAEKVKSKLYYEKEGRKLDRSIQKYEKLKSSRAKLSAVEKKEQEFSKEKQKLKLNKPEKIEYHLKQANKERAQQEKQAIEMAKASKKGQGRPTRVGGHVHKPSADPFGDNSELEPYLTKYLRPSKFRNDVPAIESSSEESSGSENDQPYQMPRPEGGKRTLRGGKKSKKILEDWEIIESSIHPDKAVLVEKKLKSKRIGHGKKLLTTKPVHTMRPEQDKWYM